MLTSAIAVLAGVALLVPGFVIAETATSGRARTKGSDLDVVLRALSYALLVHLAFSWWTVHLVGEIGPVDEWPDHLDLIWPYVTVVLLLVPALVGIALNLYLRWAERRPGPLPLAAVVFGGRDARDAFDFALSQLTEGGYLIIELKQKAADTAPRFVGGLFGRHSVAGLSPHAHNLFLQEEWHVDPPAPGTPPNLAGRIEPLRGLVVAADEIVKVHVLTPMLTPPPAAPASVSAAGGVTPTGPG